MKRVCSLCILMLAACITHAASAGPNDGKVDASFHAPDGYAFVPGTSPQQTNVQTVVDVLSQADGKVIVVGNTAFGYLGQDGTEYTNAIRVTRLLPDGSDDTSFGTFGRIDIVSPYQGNEYYEATSAAIDANGRIAIAGFYQDNFAPSQSMAVWMLTPNGALDTNFGNNNGMHIYDRDMDWTQDKANDIAFFSPRFQAAGLSGKWVFGVVGELRDSDTAPRVGVEWFFSANGSWAALATETVYPGCDRPLNAIASGMQGETPVVYVAGTMKCNGWRTVDAYVNKLWQPASHPADLYWDTSFGNAGISFFSYDPVIASQSVGAAIAVDSSGRPVITGNVQTIEGWDTFGIARLTTGGQFDTSFYGDGTRAVHFTNSPLSDPSRVNVVGVLVQNDGKIIVGGDVEQQYIDGVYFTMRMGSDGSCDNAWKARFTLSYMSGSPPSRTYVDCAGWYYSPTGPYVEEDHISAAAMSFTEGERLLLGGSIPTGNGAFGLIERFDNDSIFSDNFGW